jgi:peroxiredoxin Q/BCP
MAVRAQWPALARRPKVGERAPDFELESTQGKFRLSEHRGERVVLLFYPGDETPVCTKQFCSYRDSGDAMANLGGTVVGISSQDVASHERFTAHHDLNVPLLADQDGTVARTYGAWAPIIGTRRSVVIVDEQGVIGYRHDHTLGLDFQTADELREALDGMGREAGTAGSPPRGGRPAAERRRRGDRRRGVDRRTRR